MWRESRRCSLTGRGTLGLKLVAISSIRWKFEYNLYYLWQLWRFRYWLYCCIHLFCMDYASDLFTLKMKDLYQHISAISSSRCSSHDSAAELMIHLLYGQCVHFVLTVHCVLNFEFNHYFWNRKSYLVPFTKHNYRCYKRRMFTTLETDLYCSATYKWNIAKVTWKIHQRLVVDIF